MASPDGEYDYFSVEFWATATMWIGERSRVQDAIATQRNRELLKDYADAARKRLPVEQRVVRAVT